LVLARGSIRLAENAFHGDFKFWIQRLYKPVFVERKVGGSSRMDVGAWTREYWSFYLVPVPIRTVFCICDAELFGIIGSRKDDYFGDAFIGSYEGGISYVAKQGFRSRLVHGLHNDTASFQCSDERLHILKPTRNGQGALTSFRWPYF